MRGTTQDRVSRRVPAAPSSPLLLSRRPRFPIQALAAPHPPSRRLQARVRYFAILFNCAPSFRNILPRLAQIFSVFPARAVRFPRILLIR